MNGPKAPETDVATNRFDAIGSARAEVARHEGLLLCPESAATYAVYRTALSERRIARDEHAVLFNCGTGLKYPKPANGETRDHTGTIDYRAMVADDY